MATKITKCTCKHDYQDKRYGQGNRVHNETPPKVKGGPPGLRCTVCGTLR